MELLPYRPKTVVTPVEEKYVGKQLDTIVGYMYTMLFIFHSFMFSVFVVSQSYDREFPQSLIDLTNEF